MTGRKHDILVAGGGLAGGLIALVLRQQRPDLSICVVEESNRLGGGKRHTWIGEIESPHVFDRFRVSQWHSADFALPGTFRQVAVPVQSISAEDFDAGLRRELPREAVRLRAQIEHVAASSVRLASGEDIVARTVIDCRGFARSASLDLGWRSSLERLVACTDLHRVNAPMLVDAEGEQAGVLSFAQALPLGASELVIGEHRISRRSLIDRRELSSAVEATCARTGWQGTILGSESSTRALVAGGSIGAHYAEIGSGTVPLAGSRGLFLHPLTGSSMGAAVAVAQAIAAEADLPAEQLAAMLADRARKHWNRMSVPRKLVSKLLDAQGQGAQLAARIVTLPEDAIARLLAGQPAFLDRLRLALVRR